MARRSYVSGIKVAAKISEEETRSLYDRMMASDPKALELFYKDRLRFAVSILAEFAFAQNIPVIRSGDAEEFLKNRLYDLCRLLQRGAIQHHTGPSNYDGYLAVGLRGSLRRFFTKSQINSQRYSHHIPKHLYTNDPEVGTAEMVKLVVDCAKNANEKAYVSLTEQGLTEAEIARELNVSREAVRQMKVRIRQRLERKGLSL